jgi:hypothetical protein
MYFFLIQEIEFWSKVFQNYVDSSPKYLALFFDLVNVFQPA